MEFQSIGIFARNDDANIQKLIQQLIDTVKHCNKKVFLAKTAVQKGIKYNASIVEAKQIGTSCDLLIVIGGDGSLLHVAREMSNYNIPILGINRGRLGFLTDINPRAMAPEVQNVLNGSYQKEERNMLDIQILNKNNDIIFNSTALNDAVLYNSSVSRMIEFEVLIDNNYVMHQRADGLITATSTGSTAYTMSGGGPIIHPKLEVFTLLPMFAHTLSSRPLVVDSTSTITIKLLPSNQNNHPMLSCDGQIQKELNYHDHITLKKHAHNLQLIHPSDYNFFGTLRDKLGWNTNPSSDRFYHD